MFLKTKGLMEDTKIVKFDFIEMQTTMSKMKNYSMKDGLDGHCKRIW